MIRRTIGLLVILLGVAIAGVVDLSHAIRQSEPGDKTRGTIVSVADGDTITVAAAGGRRLHVRLLGIDTPESSTLRYGFAECGGEEAKRAMQRLAAAHPHVTLTSDPTQDKVDRYGRALAYVAPRGGGESFQAAQLQAGWALVYRYDKSNPPQRADAYDTLAERAHDADRGVWHACGGFHRREGK